MIAGESRTSSTSRSARRVAVLEMAHLLIGAVAARNGVPACGVVKRGLALQRG